MEVLHIELFGRFTVRVGDRTPVCFQTVKEQEVLAYLLLNRERPHAREAVASALWGDQCTTEQAKAYFRKALWQLHGALEAEAGSAAGLIHADARWVGVAPAPVLRLDVATLEDAYARVRDVPGRDLCDEKAALLDGAVATYAGGLLEGWYQDWCLAERERLQQIYLLVLDKLMVHAERGGRYEAGLAYGESSLRVDGARERTYYRLLRLRRALGDRTGALRLYDRCVEALRDELDATPSARTAELARALRRGDDGAGDAERPAADARNWIETVSARLGRLVGLQRQLAHLQAQVCEEMEALGRVSRREGEAEA
ncbi:MAG TPA: BTAD domain-containing putative transcriptional regulator [Rhodothermales bacterium]|nr:BTAD domain-containing putative transcriptional regulator [Rhodothermales bacterium]